MGQTKEHLFVCQMVVRGGNYYSVKRPLYLFLLSIARYVLVTRLGSDHSIDDLRHYHDNTRVTSACTGSSILI